MINQGSDPGFFHSPVIPARKMNALSDNQCFLKIKCNNPQLVTVYWPEYGLFLGKLGLAC